MKNILLVILLSFSLFASEEEISFWDNVKNSSDIELLQLYKQKYPNGTFESIADIKIKTLKKANRIEDSQLVPTWLKGKSIKYKYYGVGKANKHFKGDEYQEKLAYKRALRKLEDRLNSSSISEVKYQELLEEIEKRSYTDKKSRLYILLYIDN